MITGFQKVSSQNINLAMTGLQNAKSNYPAARYGRSADTYISSDGEYKVKQETSKLTDEMATSLAKKYDVKNMTRDEYGNLLKDLRDSGVISSQDFSVGFGGAVPYNGPSGLTIGASEDPGLEAWPFGKEKGDFTKILRACAQYCKDFSYSQDKDGKGKEICNSISGSYTRLLEIFEQIDGQTGDKAEETHAQTNAATKNAAPLTKEQREVERLTALLKEDKSFSESSNRDYFTHPIARELASAMILADKDVQAQIAKELSVSVSQMKAMLKSNDRNTSAQVLFKYDAILVRKARTEGLTETEKLLDSRLERISTVSQGTFNERMESVQKEIEESFRKENMCVDSSKTYSFHLDTSNFTFTVTGGTDKENWMMANIINSSKNLLETLSALYGHRRDDGQYNPWVIEESPYKNELLQENGVASVSNEYMEKMKSLFPAWNQWLQNNYLRDRYGFGLDDIEYKGNGTFVGKTDEITELIASMGTDFIKYGGGSLLSDIHTQLLARYGVGLHEVYFTEDGTPVGRTDETSKLIEKAGDAFLDDIKHSPKIDVPIFDGPMFILENGQFRVLYG